MGNDQTQSTTPVWRHLVHERAQLTESSPATNKDGNGENQQEDLENGLPGDPVEHLETHVLFGRRCEQLVLAAVHGRDLVDVGISVTHACTSTRGRHQFVSCRTILRTRIGAASFYPGQSVFIGPLKRRTDPLVPFVDAGGPDHVRDACDVELLADPSVC